MKKRVLVACSAKGGVPYYWFSSYDQTLRLNHPDYSFEFVMESGNSAINISRNIAAQSALEQGYWKLVQIDKDQFWNPTQLVALVSREEDIVAAPYVKKKSGPVSWLIVKTPGAEVREDGMLQCDFVGTGMLSTSVAALQHMVDFYPERRFDYEDESGATKSMTELFPIGLVGPNTPEGKLARIALAGTFRDVQDLFESLPFVQVFREPHPGTRDAGQRLAPSRQVVRQVGRRVIVSGGHRRERYDMDSTWESSADRCRPIRPPHAGGPAESPCGETCPSQDRRPTSGHKTCRPLPCQWSAHSRGGCRGQARRWPW